MVNVLVAGTVGLDTITTPFGEARDTLGGSATYAALGARLFCRVGIAAPAGTDFPEAHRRLLEERGIGLAGLARSGTTFRWAGHYEYDMNAAKTLATEVGSLATWDGAVPDAYRGAPFAFVGNMDPEQQLRVIGQLTAPRLIAADTMNYWIVRTRARLLDVVRKVHVLCLNEGEARQLFETANLVMAGRAALDLGLRGVVIKKGEHGALLLTPDHLFTASGFPLETVVDPTGCGDTFGGAFIGFLAKSQDETPATLRKALIYGQIVASFCAEGFGTENLARQSLEAVEARLAEYRRLITF